MDSLAAERLHFAPHQCGKVSHSAACHSQPAAVCTAGRTQVWVIPPMHRSWSARQGRARAL